MFSLGRGDKSRPDFITRLTLVLILLWCYESRALNAHTVTIVPALLTTSRYFNTDVIYLDSYIAIGTRLLDHLILERKLLLRKIIVRIRHTKPELRNKVSFIFVDFHRL
jgi:hypothetical protein